MLFNKKKDLLPQIKSGVFYLLSGHHKFCVVSNVPLDNLHVNLILNINTNVFDMTVKVQLSWTKAPS